MSISIATFAYVGVEIVAASIVIQYWDKNNAHLPIFVSVILIGTIAINIAGVKYDFFSTLLYRLTHSLQVLR